MPQKGEDLHHPECVSCKEHQAQVVGSKQLCQLPRIPLGLKPRSPLPPGESWEQGRFLSSLGVAYVPGARSVLESREAKRGNGSQGAAYPSQAPPHQLQSLLKALPLILRMSDWLRKQMGVSRTSYLCCLRAQPVDSTAFQGMPRAHL